MDGKTVISYPTVWQDLVFVGTMDENVYGLDLSTGRMIWRFDAGDLAGPLAVWEDLLIGGAVGFYGWEARTGKQVWKFEADMLTNWAPAIWRDLVFIVKSDPPLSPPPNIPEAFWFPLGLAESRLYALDVRIGKQVWESPRAKGQMSAPAVWEEGKIEWPMWGGNPQHTGTGVRSHKL